MINQFFSTLNFNNPKAFYCLIGLFPLLFFYVKGLNKNRVLISTISNFPLTISSKHYLRHLNFILRALAISLIIITISKPYKIKNTAYKLKDGINISLCIDVSGSMLAKDFEPSRLEACKKMVETFLKNRPYDNIGIVLFSGQPFTASSITPNNNQLINTIASIDGTMLTPGTAIGEGIAMAIAQNQQIEGNSIIILFTDGKEEGNHRINALEAAAIASKQNIKIYTIGIGSNNIALVPIIDRYGNVTNIEEQVSLDEPTLQKIAIITNAKYFKAINSKSLNSIYKEIDSIEKTTAVIDNKTEKSFIYFPFIISIIVLILLEFLITYFYINR